METMSRQLTGNLFMHSAKCRRHHPTQSFGFVSSQGDQMSFGRKVAQNVSLPFFVEINRGKSSPKMRATFAVFKKKLL
jgi:hypothetical protein